MIFEFSECEKIIGYKFKNSELFRSCFTHSSYTNEHYGIKNNERLEFFGDAILDFVVTEYLMKKFPDDDEGVLTEKRKYYVSKGPLTQVTFKLGLDKYIQLGKGVENDKDPNEKFYSSLYEAVVAGIYIDGGMKNARDFIHRTLLADENILPKEGFKAKKKDKPAIKDYKSALQEFMQKNKMGVPEYVSISKEGPDNKPVFTEGIVIAGKIVTKGVGNTKKKAQQAGAKVAYEKLLASKKRSDAKKATPKNVKPKQKKIKVKP